ncbi:MAG: 4-hydroxy-3-methylbut-2-en-1-yl diphosphate synthase [Spirochaetes bacterium ADurb.Bin110]|nr:MAG: 4-hydroxy-3-methylbut-2-en-1-yl diphosphate synthase [Spirochaetes bacterium ADurb.Bin110]
MKEILTVKVGDVLLGGEWPVHIQTMWKDPLPRFLSAEDPQLSPILTRLSSLKNLGCSIIRFAVPDIEAAESLGILADLSPMPIVADIHFDWRIALRCMDFPIAKIRINPGNIGAEWKVREVATKAKDKGIPIRIGINAGSLPRDLAQEQDVARAAIKAAEREIELLDSMSFDDIVVSLKMNHPDEVVRANEEFSLRYPYPLHLGVTEAGPLVAGIVRNTAALVPLLKKGIGATIRVSLSDSMEQEIIAGKEILACAGKGKHGVRIVSCPRCGRASFDTSAFVSRWMNRLYLLNADISVAVMGCVVNGPGEARQADLGITGAGNSVLIFKHGQIIRRVEREQADIAFEEELEALLKDEIESN